MSLISYNIFMFEDKKKTIYKKWTESKIMITQLVSTISGLFGIYGQDALDSLSSNLDFLKTNIDPKWFILISVICAVATAYFRTQSKSSQIVTKKKLEEIKEGQE